ncbi:MAG: helix-turn-helix transcriptional regulator [Clostridia bacterium]|jgi:DNA-binding PadR family transcriptional regulator|nr:helix-turn-helix transcriptional regulator [Clostridia bacterium]
MDKDNFNANVDFVRGQADMIVLSALSDSDKYGLEILSAIQERSQGMYSLKQATLYSSLKRLEKNGYVHSYDGDISNGAKRVYYGLTEIGKDHLNNDKSYWEFCNFLMSNLISDNKFDPQNESKPFDPAEFRPLTRRVRGEKDDKEHDKEKEVLVKYVYVKNGEAPQDAEVVYLSPDQLKSIERDNITDTATTATETEQSFVVANNQTVEIQNDTSESCSEEYQPSFDLTEMDLSDNVEEVQIEKVEEESEAPLDFDLTEFDFSDLYEEFLYDSQDPTQDFNLTEVFSEIENIEVISEDSHEEIVEEDIEELVEESHSADISDTDLNTSVGVQIQDSDDELIENADSNDDAILSNQDEEDLSEDVDDTDVVEDAQNNEFQSQQEISHYQEPQEYQYSSFGDRPVRNSLPSTPSSEYEHTSLPYSSYSYENDVNYVGTFTDLFNVEDEEDAQPDISADIEFLTMKEMVYKYQSKGVTIKPYDKHNTMEYYVNRYYFSNKLHLHTSLIIFAILAVELIISHVICNSTSNKVSDLWLLSILAIAIYPAIRGVMYIIDPTKKSYANYNPKTSLLLSFLPVITLPIVFALLGFVEFGANINDYLSMQRPIILPSILLFNVPLHSIIYTTLYRTYKYHIN